MNWYHRRRLRFDRANLALGMMMVVVLYAVHLALFTFSSVLGSKPLADAIQQNLRQGDIIVVDGEYASASSINFYTGQQLHLLNGVQYNLLFGSLFPDCPKIFENDASFAKLWEGPQRVFVVVLSDERLEHFKQLSRPAFEITRSGGKTVLSNQGP